MVSSFGIFVVLFTSLHTLATAQFARCNMCGVADRPISNPGLQITTAQLSSTKGTWTCREMDDAAKAGSFNEARCRSAVFLAGLYCGCISTPVTPSPVLTTPPCEICKNQVIGNPGRTVFTVAGTYTCTELITASLDGFFPAVVCGQFNRTRIAQDCGCRNAGPPTRPPTRKPAPSPTRSPSIPGIPTVCVSGENTALVQNKGTVRVKDLQIGDMVSIGQDKFSRIYSFGHRQANAVTDYLQIRINGTQQQPLEITEQHMVFLDQRGAVPASSVMVGDKLVLAQNGTLATVTKVWHVRRAGAYAPFTESGSLMVSDILTSSYITMQKDSKSFTVAGFEIASMQWLAHASQAPHRMICKLSGRFCNSETYSEDGISHWVYGPFLAGEWFMNLNVGLKLLMTPVLVLMLILFCGLETILHNIVLFTLLLIGTMVAMKNMKKTRKSC